MINMTSTHHQTPRATSRHFDVLTFRRVEVSRRAFSLIELMVVVGIIVMLVGLTVGVSVALSRNSEIRQMEQTLVLLDTALQEWELAAERQMTFGNAPGMVFDIDSSLGGGAQMQVILTRLMNTPASRDILTRIDQRFFIEELMPNGTKQFGIVDPWDRRMVPVHPGRLHTPADVGVIKDNDGTIRTSGGDVHENRLGIGQNRRIAFICRGPDGELGNLHLDKAYNTLTPAEVANVKLADDNLYSYPLGRERP